MLLEDFLPDKWWRNHPGYAAVLASIYSVISLFIATQVFAGNPGIVSITFLTLFLLPSITLIRTHTSSPDISLFIQRFLGSMHLTKAYAAYFAGTFFTYLSVAFLLPFAGVNVIQIVREQLLLLPGLTGGATFAMSQFTSIFANNWFVLIIVFLFAVIWRDGGMFFVLWNASAWGAIFGYRAVGAAAAAGTNPWYYLGVELSQVIWHTALEASAYILAAVAGSVIGRHAYVGDEIPGYFIASVSGLFLATFGAKTVFEFAQLPTIISTGLGILVFFASAYTLSDSLVESKEQFTQGMCVLAAALVLFAVGAAIETFVLSNSTSLNTVYKYSSMFINR
jgi:hypothetical protein